jgi:class 3 adenylate cyclase
MSNSEPTSDPSEPSYQELEESLKRLEGERSKRLQNQQELAAAKDRVDQELVRFAVMQGLFEQTLEAADEDTFIEITLEAIIEAFELEIAFFLLAIPGSSRFSVAGMFGADLAEYTEFELDEALYRDGQPRIMEPGTADGALLDSLGLVNGMACPFSDRSDKMTGLLIVGMSEEGRNIYEPVTSDICSSFGVLARQTGAVWITRQLNQEILNQNKRLKDLTESYSRFVPFEFLKLLARNSIEEIGAGDSVALDLNVLFADIRGFTTLSEQMISIEVFESLNEFLSQIEPVISKNGGFINQYMGDAVMALFPGHPDDALTCAIEMRKVVQPFNHQRGKQKLARMDFGLGMQAGPLTLGALGGGKRLDSNVIGDAANVASRVEGLTRKYGVHALTTTELTDRLVNFDQFCLREIDTVTVKGRLQPMTLVEVLDCDDEEDRAARSQTAVQFAKGRQAYVKGEFAKAGEIFAQCLDEAGNDTVAQIMLERCKMLTKTQRASTWDGVWHWDEK